jgi:hypothetical protein
VPRIIPLHRRAGKLKIARRLDVAALEPWKCTRAQENISLSYARTAALDFSVR